MLMGACGYTRLREHWENRKNWDTAVCFALSDKEKEVMELFCNSYCGVLISECTNQRVSTSAP